MTKLEIRELTLEYTQGDYLVRPIDSLSVNARDGELVILLGPSGCGKTTLLSCLAGILTPTAGQIRLGDTDVTLLRRSAMAHYRRHTVGIVFQAFNLLPSLTARENVMAPLLVAGVRRSKARARAEELLALVGLEHRVNHRPRELSGGQQQRVAIARALVHDPRLVLADEPTAHLDFIQVEEVLRIIRDLAQPGRLVVVATHDERLVPLADRTIELLPQSAPGQSPPEHHTLEAGEVLFVQGAPSDFVYVVEEGVVELLRERPDHTHDVVRRVGAGSYFGELGPLCRLPRSATAQAATRAVVTSYTLQDFKRFSKEPAVVPAL